MARTRAGSSNTFEDLVITGLGHLSHDAIGKGLVSFIVMLCVWTFVVHWGLIFGVMWSANAPLAALGTALHQVIHMLLLASLYKAVTTDPGFVARPQSHQDRSEFCEKCSHHRPERAHHCKVCKRCVKKMDHHCLFVNNCVGSYNLKFFFLLLLYTVLGGTYNAIISYTWSQIKRPRGNDVLGFERGMVLANGVTIFVISLILLPFVSIHIYLAATNTTTLEALKGRTKQYDLGSHMRNLKHAFGSNPWLWLSPFHYHVSDQEFLLDIL